MKNKLAKLKYLPNNFEIIENGDKKKYQFSIVQDWVKYPLKAPMKYMKVDWSRFVKHIKDRQMVTK